MGVDRALELFFTLAAVVGGPLLAVIVVPALAKRIVGKVARRPDAVEADNPELDDLTRRVAELEERLDFAERQLVRKGDR